MTEPLPLAFYGTLACATLGGGLSLWLVHLLVRKAPLLLRLRRLPASQRATTIVEFPFVLLLVVQMTLLTWQLGLMSAAYLTMDYAAFAAARSAAVIVPENYKKPDHAIDEASNKLNSSDFSAYDAILSRAPNAGSSLKSGKGTDIRHAAVFVCYAISGTYRSDNFDVQAAMSSLMDSDVPPDFLGLKGSLVGLLGDALGSGLASASEIADMLPSEVDYANRFGYAWLNTRVRVQPDVPRSTKTIQDMFPDSAQFREAMTFLNGFTSADDTSWWETAMFSTTNLDIGAGATMTVEVNHDFQLAVPFAGALLSGWRSKQGIGWYTTLTARASILNEGYAEEEPKSGN